jgi:[acyl-carrier-protein] S-malonyltransferase
MTDKIIPQKTALVFPGQGSQMVAMGKDLFDNFAVAREVFNKVDKILVPFLKTNLSEIIFNGPSEELTKTENAQPALMAVSIAIVRVIEQESGKKISDFAKFVAGHSLGEYSALCAAGAISLEDTAKLLEIRGSEMAKCGLKEQGAMAAILGAEIEVVKQIVKEVVESEPGSVCQIANDNSVGQIVISGSKSAITKAIEIAKHKGAKRAIMLPVSGAFHSRLMSDAAQHVKQALDVTLVKSPTIPLIANVVALEVNDALKIKELLVEQITGSVRWRESMIYMQNNGIEEIIEIGSGKVLSSMVGRTCANIKSSSVQNTDDIAAFLNRL